MPNTARAEFDHVRVTDWFKRHLIFYHIMTSTIPMSDPVQENQMTDIQIATFSNFFFGCWRLLRSHRPGSSSD